jgi:hypothetical protein
MLDFCYRYIQDNGIQTSKELLSAYEKQDCSTKKTGHCSIKELSMTLSKNKLFFRTKESFGVDHNKNKIYKYDIRDVNEVARKLASLTHMQTEPKHFPRVLKDAYDACVAEQKSLSVMGESVGIRE